MSELQERFQRWADELVDLTARKELQTQENPVRDWASKNGAKETRTPDPLHAIEGFWARKALDMTGLDLN